MRGDVEFSVNLELAPEEVAVIYEVVTFYKSAHPQPNPILDSVEEEIVFLINKIREVMTFSDSLENDGTSPSPPKTTTAIESSPEPEHEDEPGLVDPDEELSE